METPIGTIYSTNITPDKEHGIGGYTFEEFDDAVRKGVRKTVPRSIRRCRIPRSRGSAKRTCAPCTPTLCTAWSR